MKRKTLIFHIGYPKAGSTTLQKQIFPNLSSVTFMGKGKLLNIDQLNDWRPPKLYELNALYVASMLRPYIENSPTDKIVMSIEGILSKEGVIRPGGLADGFHDINFITSDGSNGDIDPRPTAQCLKQIFLDYLGDIANIKIVIVIRNQGSLLASLYAKNDWYRDNIISHLNTTLNYHYNNTFEDYSHYIFNVNQGALIPYLNYYHVVNTFVDLFGYENVHINLMEALFDPENHSARCRLAKFMGINSYSIEENFNPKMKLNSRSDGGNKYAYNKSKNTMRLTYTRKLIKTIWSISKPFFGFLKKSRQFQALQKLIIKKFSKQETNMYDFEVTENQKANITRKFTSSNMNLANQYNLNYEFKYYKYF